jgi:predicted DNA-binding protein YlxM (UPF0122 family)
MLCNKYQLRQGIKEYIRKDIIGVYIMTILEAWNLQGSIKGVSKLTGYSNDKIIKELSTLGIVINDTHKDIMELYNKDLSVIEIANRLKISPKVVRRYLPRVRPEYNVNPSKNALAIKKYRQKKQSVDM